VRNIIKMKTKIMCEECGAKCKLGYDYDGEEKPIPIYAECLKCGWSVC